MLIKTLRKPGVWRRIVLYSFGILISYIAFFSIFAFKYRAHIENMILQDLSLQEYIKERIISRLDPSFLQRYLDGMSSEDQALLCARYATLVSVSSSVKEIKDGFHDIKRAIEDREGNCSEIAVINYISFIQVVTDLKRPELLDFFRFCVGNKRYFDSPPVGHAWLEIRINGNWIPYEPSRIPFLNLFDGDDLEGEDIKKIREEDVLDVPNSFEKKADYQIFSDRTYTVKVYFSEFVNPVPEIYKLVSGN